MFVSKNDFQTFNQLNGHNISFEDSMGVSNLFPLELHLAFLSKMISAFIRVRKVVVGLESWSLQSITCIFGDMFTVYFSSHLYSASESDCICQTIIVQLL